MFAEETQQTQQSEEQESVAAKASEVVSDVAGEVLPAVADHKAAELVRGLEAIDGEVMRQAAASELAPVKEGAKVLEKRFAAIALKALRTIIRADVPVVGPSSINGNIISGEDEQRSIDAWIRKGEEAATSQSTPPPAQEAQTAPAPKSAPKASASSESVVDVFGPRVSRAEINQQRQEAAAAKAKVERERQAARAAAEEARRQRNADREERARKSGQAELME